MKLINKTIDYSIKHTSNIHQNYIKYTILTQIALNDNMYIFCDS